MIVCKSPIFMTLKEMSVTYDLFKKNQNLHLFLKKITTMGSLS